MTAAIAQKVVDGIPEKIDALGIKMLWDLANRLPHAEDKRLASARHQALSLSLGDPGVVREVTFGFQHDGVNVTGFRLYASSIPPEADGTFTADHQFEVGLPQPGPSGERYFHFVDVANRLNDAVPYFLWATAYNSAGEEVVESLPSNVLHERLPSFARGDVNQDGVIDTADVDKLVRILMGEDEALAVADVNADGWVTHTDLTALLLKIRNP